MKRLVETLHGAGNVITRDGNSIGCRPYALRVWRTLIENDRGSTKAGLLSVEGYIDLTSREATALLVTGEPLTLELKDGRRLPFYMRSTSGRIAASGELR